MKQESKEKKEKGKKEMRYDQSYKIVENNYNFVG